MSAMSNNSKSKLSLAIIISIILHVALIIILSYRLTQDDSNNYGSNNGQTIDAIMVDPTIMSEQYQRQMQSQISQQKAEQQRKEQIDRQFQNFQEKQLAQQQQLQELEKERLKLEEKLKQEQKAAIGKLEAEKRAAEQKAAAEEKAIAEKLEAKKKAEEKKVEEEKIAKERLAIKQKAAAAQNDKKVNDLLGGIISTSSSSLTRKGTSNGELDKYIFLVKSAISNKFINPNKLYVGQSCMLEIRIAPDGLLLDVKVLGGDEVLCREALAATKLAVIPKPSNILYNEVKRMKINFEPK
jgi:colicin import membrane protein